MLIVAIVEYAIKAAVDFPGDTLRDRASSLINVFCFSKFSRPVWSEASNRKRTSAFISKIGNSDEVKREAKEMNN